MIDWRIIEDAIQAWAKTESGIQVIWSHQAAESPEPPYLTLSITSIKQIGAFDELRHSDDGFYKCGMRRLSISVQAYGQNAFATLNSLKDSLELEAVEQTLKQAGISPVMASDITQIPEFIDTIWEDRVHMDVVFHVAINNFQPESFEIEGIKGKGSFMTENRTHEEPLEIEK